MKIRLEHLIKITIDPWADLPRIPRGCDKWDAYHREIERREISRIILNNELEQKEED